MVPFYLYTRQKNVRKITYINKKYAFHRLYEYFIDLLI